MGLAEVIGSRLITYRQVPYQITTSIFHPNHQWLPVSLYRERRAYLALFDHRKRVLLVDALMTICVARLLDDWYVAC